MGLVNVQQKYCKINKKKSAIFSAQNKIFGQLEMLTKMVSNPPPFLFLRLKWF